MAVQMLLLKPMFHLAFQVLFCNVTTFSMHNGPVAWQFFYLKSALVVLDGASLVPECADREELGLLCSISPISQAAGCSYTKMDSIHDPVE